MAEESNHEESKTELYELAVAHTLRQRLKDQYCNTDKHWTQTNQKKVCLIAPETQFPQSVKSTLLTLNLEDQYREALSSLDVKLEDFKNLETSNFVCKSSQFVFGLLEALATKEIPSKGYSSFR